MTAYALHHHARMFADTRRNPAYARAIAGAVRPGGVVLDIGTGSGVLAFLACRAGAARVYAVEPEPAIDIAREIARASGLTDRITFLQRHSLDVELPETVDVIVADIRGTLPLAGRAVPSLIDARLRWLKPGGAMIPMLDVISGAVVSAPRPYREHVLAWDGSAHGVDASPLRVAATNAVTTLAGGDETLSDGAVWTAIDYRTVTAASVRGTLDWTISRAGEAHGFVLWFDARLSESASYGTGPGSGDRLYGRAFFPWPEPVRLASGTRVHVRLRADYSDGAYVWTWVSEFSPGSAGSFTQSTFLGAPLSTETLARRAPDFAPGLGVEGQVDAVVLSLLGAGATVGAIADHLVERFPARFATREAALGRAVRLGGRYGS